MANPRIDPPHQAVGEQVPCHHQYGADRSRRHDDRVVPRQHGFDQAAPDAGPGEHKFHEHAAREQRRERQPEQDRHRDERVAGDVPPHDREGRESLGPGAAHERLAHHLEHRGADESRDAPDADQRESGQRQHQVTQPVEEPRSADEEVAVEPRAPEGGQRPGPVCEYHDQHQAQPVPRNGEQRHRRHRERRVDARAGGRLDRAHRHAEQVAQQERQADELERGRDRLAQQRAYRPSRGDARPPFPAGETAEPGADLQSVNPLVTVHPLAKQVERYVLLTTLLRYDSTLAPQPYLARQWTWSPDRQMLVLRLQAGVRWHDGVVTSARDVAWTLNAARDPATGYPRLNDLADVVFVNDRDDSTVVIRFARPQRGIPDVLTDLAILPGYLLGSVTHV